MQDEMNHNTLVVTGTPSLVTGALTVDTDQALSFNGTTNSAAAADSASLSITGSMSLECFVRLSAYPGTTQNLVAKSGSYSIGIDTTGHLIFTVVGTGTVSVVANVVLTLNTWYHVVCVYNGNYAGVQQFGKSSIGSTSVAIFDDGLNSKVVSKYTLVETAIINDVNFSLQYVDEIWPVQMRAVVYADNAGAPGVLVTQSDTVLLNAPNPQFRAWTWINFPLTPAVLPAGNYHLGCISDTVSSSSKAPLEIGREATGGTTSYGADSVSSASNPFGGISSSNANVLAIYSNYTATSRTGKEGKALIYINGALNTSAVYSGGVTDTANSFQVCPSLAAQVDEVSVWNKALADVQIATHYNAH